MAENIVQGFRQVIQDLLVPELKALQVEVKHVQETVSAQGQELRALRQETNERFEALHREMNERFAKVDERFEALHREMNERFARVDERFEALHREMNERFAKVDERFEALHREMNERFARVDERFADVMEQIAQLRQTDSVILGQLEKILDRLDWSDTIRELQVNIHRVADRVGVQL